MPDVKSPPIRRLVVPADFGGTKFTDTMDIDQEAHRLYMGDNWSYGIDVFDIAAGSPTYLKTIRSTTMRPAAFFGLCVAKSVKKVFVAHGTSLVSIIDIDPESSTSDTVVGTLSTGGLGMADLIDYDPEHRKIYVANRDGHFLTSIDAVTNRVMNRIENLGGALEQPRFNQRDGMVYLVSNADNLIHQIDPLTDRLVHTYEIGEDCRPNGLAINPTTGLALLASGNHERPHTAIWNLNTHRLEAIIEDCGCGDGAIYDAVVDRYFFAASEFPSGPTMGIFDGKSAKFLLNVPTLPGASWVAFDQTHNLVYAPAIHDGKPALISFPLPESY